MKTTKKQKERNKQMKYNVLFYFNTNAKSEKQFNSYKSILTEITKLDNSFAGLKDFQVLEGGEDKTNDFLNSILP